LEFIYVLFDFIDCSYKHSLSDISSTSLSLESITVELLTFGGDFLPYFFIILMFLC
jgi:hypothetical protein